MLYIWPEAIADYYVIRIKLLDRAVTRGSARDPVSLKFISLRSK